MFVKSPWTRGGKPERWKLHWKFPPPAQGTPALPPRGTWKEMEFVTNAQICFVLLVKKCLQSLLWEEKCKSQAAHNRTGFPSDPPLSHQKGVFNKRGKRSGEHENIQVVFQSKWLVLARRGINFLLRTPTGLTPPLTPPLRGEEMGSWNPGRRRGWQRSERRIAEAHLQIYLSTGWKKDDPTYFDLGSKIR